MRQFTSHLDFSLTKKRLIMMGKRISGLKVGAIWLFVLPVSVASIIVFVTRPNHYPRTISIEELRKSLPPTQYYDVELNCDGAYPCGLYDPLDERTGVLKNSDGQPFTGERNVFLVETDSLIAKHYIENGKILKFEIFIRDSLGNYQYSSVSIPSLDDHGNKVTTTLTNRLTDSLVLRSEKIQTDSLNTHKIYHPNGQLANLFYFRPNFGIDGIATLFDENGKITEQRRYEKGELIEEIK